MPNPIRFRRFDVRPLIARGLQPLAEIRARVAALAADEGLTVVAPMLPSPLIELLRSEGFESRIERGSGGDWVVSFWRSLR